jgi:hypothetical protein
MSGFLSSLFGSPGAGKPGDSGYAVADVYRDLRQKVLAVDPSSLGLAPAGPGGVWGLLMETGHPKAVATLVALADGTVSLYFSNGGGIIGIGQHEGPRQAGEALLKFAPRFLAHAVPTKAYPLPREGFTRFYFLTGGGIATAEADEGSLAGDRSPLSPLFRKAHEVITQARLATEQAKTGAGTAAGGGEASLAQRLMRAATTGDASAVRALLEQGADPNAADPSGLTPLMAAAFSGQERTLSLLLASGRASVDARDASGYTALMFACNAGQPACAWALIGAGADVNARDKDDSTPVMFAAQHGFDEIVRMLLKKGADLALVGRHGLSAVDFARQNKRVETERLLQSFKKA